MGKTLKRKSSTQSWSEPIFGAQKPTKAGERILASAAGLFARFGYNGVSTRDVALIAQVNEVTVYRLYARKRALYRAVLDSELQQLCFRGDLLSRIAECTDGRAALERTFDLLAGTMLPRPGVLRLLQYYALEMSDEFDPLVRKHLGELVEVAARYRDPWIKNGELRGTDGKTIILTLIGIILSHDSLHRVFGAPDPSREQMFEAYANFAFAGKGESTDMLPRE